LHIGSIYLIKLCLIPSLKFLQGGLSFFFIYIPNGDPCAIFKKPGYGGLTNAIGSPVMMATLSCNFPIEKIYLFNNEIGLAIKLLQQEAKRKFSWRRKGEIWG
jgi:hypothetical protein